MYEGISGVPDTADAWATADADGDATDYSGSVTMCWFK